MTAAIHAHKQGFINGMPIMSGDISMPDRPWSDAYRGFRPALSPPRVSVNVVLIISGNWQIEWLAQLCQGTGNIVSLGAGRVCPYCGDYNPAGLASCWRCGGKTGIEQFVKVDNFPFVLSCYQVSQLAIGKDPVFATDLEFVSTGTVLTSHLPFFNPSLSIEGLPYTYISNTGYYLCCYCGSMVEDGSICPNCGGVRIPWSEVVKMDRDCIYCGQKVVGGVVCSNCGGRIAAESYRMYKEA